MAHIGYLKRFFCFGIFLVLILECIVKTQAVSVMSIDFGSEWMKVSIVSPGVPMEIALNKESKRKTPIAIAFRDGERTFGEDALAVGVRFPKNCYAYLLDLLGKTVDNPIVSLYKERFPYYDIVADPARNTVVFQHDAETKFSVEELVAMMISKAREIAQNSAQQPINEAVITVPGYFNQAERLAMLQSAELAGIKVLQLINDYTAVALNYGIFRRKDFNETAQYIMFYDMGSSSTSATVVSYQLVKTKEKGYVETNPQLSILGVGYDRFLGGLEMQLRLRDHLGKKFNEMKKTKNDVFKNARSLAKLFKEAGRLKNVLSANNDHFAQVEGLLDEIDFKLQVTREEFENLCKDLFDRVQSPIHTALKTSGLSMDVISQVILVGAGTRVPAVQEKLSSAVGMELSKNLNTDEAAVFGAVYKAADLSAGFKVKKFLTKDATLFPIQVVFDREGDSGAIRQTKRTLFSLMNPYPQKKILTFNKNLTDFEFNVVYNDLDYLSEKEISAIGTLQLKKVTLSGVIASLEEYSGANHDIKGIKAHFNMDESGLLHLLNVELVVEKTVNSENDPANEESSFSKLGSTISKLFTGPEETLKENIEKPEEKEEIKESDKKAEKGPETNKTKEETEKDEKKPKEEAAKPFITLKKPINAKEERLVVPALDEKQFEDSKKKIADLNSVDEIKRRHEGALNALESFVFEARAKLETDEYKKASTSDETKAVNELCAKLSDWLDEEGFSANVETLESKLGELKKLTKNIWSRVREHRERPEALTTLNGILNGSQVFLTTIKNVSSQQESPESFVFTQVEIDALEKLIKETTEWKDKAVLEQNQLSPAENPKLTIKLITEKMQLLDREVKYLVNKAKIWKPKQQEDKLKKNETESPKSDNSTEKIIPEPTEVPTDEKVEEPKVEEEQTQKTDDIKKEGDEKKHSEL